MKPPMVVLVLLEKDGEFTHIDTLSDDQEISLLEAAVSQGESDPLGQVYLAREKQSQEDDEFGEYVEELLSQPFLRPEIQEHAVQWLKSKIRIEEFQKNEQEAATVIADYAYRVFQKDRSRKDFFLAGPKTQVRVKVLVFKPSQVPAQVA